jgi:hypothetical protein
MERIFDKFLKHQFITLLKFNAKAGREDIFKPTIGNKTLHEISNHNAGRAVNFATSKILTVKSTMFPYRNIHKCTWTSPDGKTHNQTDNILTGDVGEGIRVYLMFDHSGQQIVILITIWRGQS